VTDDDTNAGGGPISAILDYVQQTAWALEPGVLQQLAAIVERHISGTALPAADVEAIVAARDQRASHPDSERIGNTEIIPISGVIAKYSRQVNRVSQPRGTSVERIREQLEAAMADEAVGRVLLRIESPGGTVDGLADLADEIHAAGDRKPVIAYADGMACSAAYYLGSQALRFYASRDAVVGSIGVYAVVLDSSRRAENLGLRLHIIRSGPHKGAGEPGIPISDEQLEPLRRRVDFHFQEFLAAVRRGRGIDADRLVEAATGESFLPAEARERGLIDGIKTFRQALAAATPAPRIIAATPAARTKGNPMSDDAIDKTDRQNEIDLEAERKAAADKATEAERQRIAAIGDALGDFPEVLQLATREGDTLTEAKARAFDSIRVRLTAVEKERDEANDRLESVAKGGVKPRALDPSDAEEEPAVDGGTAETDFADPAKPPADDGKAETYDRRVAGLKTLDGWTEARAFRRAAHELPLAHDAWKATRPVLSGGR